MAEITKRTNTIIELIAVGENCVYSIGKIQVTKQGDIYLASKIKATGLEGLHFSRHRDGTCHIRMKGKEIENGFEKRIPISDFDGFEFLQGWGFGLESLPILHKEYRLSPTKCNSIVAINMRHFKDMPFCLGIAILTESGVHHLLNSYKDFKNRQVYICANSQPMVGIVFGAVNEDKALARAIKEGESTAIVNQDFAEIASKKT